MDSKDAMRKAKNDISEVARNRFSIAPSFPRITKRREFGLAYGLASGMRAYKLTKRYEPLLHKMFRDSRDVSDI